MMKLRMRKDVTEKVSLLSMELDRNRVMMKGTLVVIIASWRQ